MQAARDALAGTYTYLNDAAPLLYNLAVLAEARGEYDLAESMLGRATGLEPKALYFEALDRVRRARGDSEAMNNK